MISKRWLFSMVIIFVVNILFASICSASDTESDRATLKGLEGVFVLIEELNPVLKEGGLTEKQIQTDVELKLRLAGIRVSSENESHKIPGIPPLYVKVHAKKTESGFFLFNIYIGVIQQIILTRNPAITSHSDTWSTMGGPGYSRTNTLRENIKDFVDQFINAYLSANPKN